MTEPFIRPSRWAAPLVLAPCAAAVFGAAVWWAADSTPSTAAAPAPASPAYSPGPATTPAAVEAAHRDLARTLAARRHDAAALQRRLKHLRAELHRLHAAPVVGADPVVTASGGGNYGSGGGNSPVVDAPAPVVQRPVVAAPVNPAPPPVHTTTGASG